MKSPALSAWATCLRLLFVLSIFVSTLALQPLYAQTTTIPGCSPVARENLKPGTDQWQLTTPADDVNHQIKGYASSTSVNLGDTIDFYVSVTPIQTYTIEVYRMGWYDGLGGRLMTTTMPISGTVQPPVNVDATTGMISAPWTSDYSLTIPAHWVSGIYAAKLINAAGFENYVIFVVRNDSQAATLLYQHSVTTDQAYNNYPDDGITGKSLYDHNSYGTNTVSGGKRAVKISFDRPMTGDGAGFLFEWEYPLIRWLEKSGYNVSYSSNLDTHQNGANLLNYAGFLSTGHDEYWSKEMRDAAEAARDAGVNLAFFGSNAVYWQVRFEPSTAGTPDRVMTSYKNWNLDPTTDNSRKTYLWRTIWQREEQKLIGVQYESYGRSDKNTDYVVTNSDHWIYADTGFVDGDAVPGLVGYEVDNYQSTYATPANQSYTLLSSSPYTDTYGDVVTANSSIYQAPSDAWVFGAGTMSWSWGLDKPGYTDSRIQQTTANLLNHFEGAAPLPCNPISAPGTVTLVSPSSQISTPSPVYKWTVDPVATDYTLVVYSLAQNSIQHMQSYSASEICDTTHCMVEPSASLGTGAHTWLIQTEENGIKGPWSTFEAE